MHRLPLAEAEPPPPPYAVDTRMDTGKMQPLRQDCDTALPQLKASELSGLSAFSEWYFCDRSL
jgi:hypothetical protein